LVFIALYVLFRKIRKISRTSILFFLIALIVSFLLMTGRHSPFYFIFSFWPFTLFRVPSRFIWVFEIALIIISVHSFNSILEYFKKSRALFLLSILIVSIHVLSLFFTWSPYHALVPAREWLKDPSLSQFIDRRFNTISIGAERLYGSVYEPNGWSNPKKDYDPSYLLRNTFTPDKNMLWRISQIHDYAGRSIRRSRVFNDLLSQSITTDASNATISATGMKFLSLLSIKNIISTLPLTHQGLLLRVQLADATHSIDLYENPDSLPRIYFAKRTVVIRTVEDAVKQFISDDYNPKETVLVENPLTPYAFESFGSAQITATEEGRLQASVSNPHDGAVLVLTQTFYPGWHARIDNVETTVFPVNIKHIGIQVPTGNHKVEFYYMPKSFVYGALISIITLSITIVLMVFGFYRLLFGTHQKTHPLYPHRRHNHGR
jgi:hypothetical protein